ncbi:DUF803 domain membrane protein [Aspergillus sp. HF37]|nr:DUF803 domain membrane protein [Aspergillus sp. HF37]
MDSAGTLAARASLLDPRNDGSGDSRPAAYRAVGISLAVASGLFIGVSFVLKKTGLLKANVKYNEEAGEGYGYLRNAWWWSGMTLMIIGEVCNFVAYAFVDAILVTPLGALSVVVTTILSAIFLKERLSFVGKVGCFACIVGSVVIAMNAPKQSSVSDIQEMKDYVVTPGFLSYAASSSSAVSPPPMIGGLSVVATQGLGAAIIAQINGKSQFNQWFLYVLFVFVVATLLTEIIYLNKALNIFNAALVTPTYYVIFTSATIITSAILFRGFNASGVEVATIIMGFLQICSGVVLLQLSRSAKDVPDAAVFKGDLDQVREVATQEEPETEPRADSIRGAASIVRRMSTPRRNMEQEEARRFFREKREDSLYTPPENEVIEWDGLRRRRTVVGEGPTMSRPRTPGTPGSMKSAFPPLGMSHFPEDDEHVDEKSSMKQSGHDILEGSRSHATALLHPSRWRQPKPGLHDNQTNAEGARPPGSDVGASQTRERSGTGHSITWADEVNPGASHSANSVASEPVPHAGRQFSFNRMINRIRGGGEPPNTQPRPPRGILRRTLDQKPTRPSTEEERLGLVHGDPQTLDDMYMNEKLERSSSSSSSSSESSESGGGGRRLVEARPRGPPSLSTMSTTSFPSYEEHDYYASAEETGPPGMEAPTTRTITAYAPRPGPSRTNPLPPLPDEDLVLAGRTEPWMRVELRSPGHSQDGRGGWRRPGTGDGQAGGTAGAFA